MVVSVPTLTLGTVPVPVPPSTCPQPALVPLLALVPGAQLGDSPTTVPVPIPIPPLLVPTVAPVPTPSLFLSPCHPLLVPICVLTLPWFSFWYMSLFPSQSLSPRPSQSLCPSQSLSPRHCPSLFPFPPQCWSPWWLVSPSHPRFCPSATPCLSPSFPTSLPGPCPHLCPHPFPVPHPGLCRHHSTHPCSCPRAPVSPVATLRTLNPTWGPCATLGALSHHGDLVPNLGTLCRSILETLCHLIHAVPTLGTLCTP